MKNPKKKEKTEERKRYDKKKKEKIKKEDDNIVKVLITKYCGYRNQYFIFIGHS